MQSQKLIILKYFNKINIIFYKIKINYKALATLSLCSGNFNEKFEVSLSIDLAHPAVL